MDKVKTTPLAGAKSGDVIILGKPLGLGILSTALKNGQLDDAGQAELQRVSQLPDDVGTQIAAIDGVHAMTSVTGLGLAGQLLALCRDAGVSAQIEYVQVPVIEAAEIHAKNGVAPDAAQDNWSAYGAQVELAPHIESWHRALLTDLQDGGGLLVTCAPMAAVSVLMKFQAAGLVEAAAIGRLGKGEPKLKVA
jgi:selenide,water dikinase